MAEGTHRHVQNPWLTLSVAEQGIISCTGPVDPIVATTAPLGDVTTRGTETCDFPHGMGKPTVAQCQSAADHNTVADSSGTMCAKSGWCRLMNKRCNAQCEPPAQNPVPLAPPDKQKQIQVVKVRSQISTLGDSSATTPQEKSLSRTVSLCSLFLAHLKGVGHTGNLMLAMKAGCAK
jgi:hypothetical protein